VCYALTLGHGGSGSDPAASPANSTGCSAGQYVAGQVITLTASPAAGWQVSGWSGTSNDASTSTSNSLTMPASATAASVTYTEIPPPTCYALTLGHSGSGSDPAASPANSAGCSAGQYVAGQVITLTASPAAGWQVSGWSGTSNNASTSTSNSLTMPASATAASVTYSEQTCDALPVGLHQQTHAFIAYTGSWITFTGTGPSGGSVKYTNDPSATVSFCINGSQMTIYRTKHPNRGPADVYIDGAFHSTMQNYNATLVWAVPEVFSGLGAGTHTVEIRNTSSAYIDLDAVRVD